MPSPDTTNCSCEVKLKDAHKVLLMQAKALRNNAHQLHEEALKLQHEAIGFEKAAQEMLIVFSTEKTA